MKTNKLQPIHPGEILREEFMQPRGRSQNALARADNLNPHDKVCPAFASSDGRKSHSEAGELIVTCFEDQVAGVGTDDFASET